MPPLRSPERILIQTERLLLRLPRHGDEAQMVKFYADNREFLQPYSPAFSEELFTIRGWRDRIDATTAEYRGGRGFRLVMFLRSEPSTAIGIANFTSITGFPTFLCNLGYSIAEQAQGKGLMTEALSGAIHYLFSELGIHRIEANYMPRNEKSARVLAKLGFTIEGHAKNYILINGQWEDHVRTSLTNPNWVERWALSV